MKEGHIEAAMNRLGEFLDRYQKISAESSQRLNNINNNSEVEKAKRDAQNAIAALQNPSQTAMEFAGDEIKELNEQRAALNAALNEAESLNNQAADLERQAAEIRSNNDIEKNKILKRIEDINARAQHKINTTSWVNLALDQEVHETNSVREKVTNLTARERKAVKLLEEAADLKRQAIGKYKSVARNGNSAEENLKAVEVIAQNKQKTQDESKAYKDEIDQRMAALSNIDYERFAPGAVNQINNQVNAFNRAYSSKDYSTCINTGKTVVDALKDFVKNVTELKNKFEEAETNTKDHLQAAMNEFNAVDKADCTSFTKEDVLNPQGWVMLNYLVDPRTGLGRFRNFRISNYDLMLKLVDVCASASIDDIMNDPDVKERVELYNSQRSDFEEQIKRDTRLDGKIAILDIRNEEVIHVGNRFLIYALYPEANVSIHVMNGKQHQNTVFAVGKSIFNPTSKLDIGALMYEYGGGGHMNAGTCQVENDKYEETLGSIISRINELSGDSVSGSPSENTESVTE